MSQKGYLTSDEYKALRQLLGFTQEQAKEFHKVQNIRTIKRWESGYSRVSELACDKITELSKKINWTINECLKLADAPDVEEVVLIVYPESCYKKFAAGFEDLPNSVHRAAIARTYSGITQLGKKCGIVEFNPQDYFIFLSANNVKDSPAARSAWAAEYRDRLLL